MLLLLLASATVVDAAGQKLWELGLEVEDNSLTAFLMFCFVVGITCLVEGAKHTAEKKIKDPWRKQSLQAIYVELMMVGVVSFLLILLAELGLLDVRITIGCDDNATPAPPASGSGSGTECGFGFDLILFEYAHLVLFFMGIMYCIFIALAFFARDRMTATIAEVQQKTLHEWYEESPTPTGELSVMGFYWDKGTWARTVLTLRAAIIIEHSAKMQALCAPDIQELRKAIHKHMAKPLPAAFPPPEAAVRQFDMARFAKIATSDVLLEFLHIPPIAWLFVLLVAAANLIHRAGVDLADALLYVAFFGPAIALFLLWRLSIHLTYLARRTCGHPSIPHIEFHRAEGKRGALNLRDKDALVGLEWAQGGEDPWEILTGCCEDGSTFDFLDPLDPGALERQIQISLLVLCFSIGQLAMLSRLLFSHIGALGLLCWILPMPPVAIWIPRAILVYALTHRTKEINEKWLAYALQANDDPEDDADKVGTKFHFNELERRVVANNIRKMGAGASSAAGTDAVVTTQPLTVRQELSPRHLPATPSNFGSYTPLSVVTPTARGPFPAGAFPPSARSPGGGVVSPSGLSPHGSVYSNGTGRGGYRFNNNPSGLFLSQN